MGTGDFSVSKLFKLLACIVIDIALVILFIDAFSLFSVIAFEKSLLMFLVLLTGLAVTNLAVFFPNAWSRKMGVVHSASIIIVSFVYAITANVLSILLISSSVTWYVIVELILFAMLLGCFAALAFFAQKTTESSRNDEIEQAAKQSLAMQLIQIEAALQAKQDEEGMSAIIQAFKRVKERINASTPFGRMAGNRTINEIENTIQQNMEFIQLQIKTFAAGHNSEDLLKLLDETLRLVKNRESLNIR